MSGIVLYEEGNRAASEPGVPYVRLVQVDDPSGSFGYYILHCQVTGPDGARGRGPQRFLVNSRELLGPEVINDAQAIRLAIARYDELARNGAPSDQQEFNEALSLLQEALSHVDDDLENQIEDFLDRVLVKEGEGGQ